MSNGLEWRLINRNWSKIPEKAIGNETVIYIACYMVHGLKKKNVEDFRFDVLAILVSGVRGPGGVATLFISRAIR